MPVTPAKALNELTKVIEKQNKDLKQKEAIDKVDADITALEEANTENSKELRDLFGKVLAVLTDDESSVKARSLAEKQLEQLQSMTETEEENREKQAVAEDQANWLEKIAGGIDNLANSFDKFADGAKKGLGLFGALAALFLLFTDPEKLFTAVKWAIEKVFGIVRMIEAFFSGDMATAMTEFKENWEAIALIVGGTLLFFGGKIIRVISSVVRGIKGFFTFIVDIGKSIKGAWDKMKVMKEKIANIGKSVKSAGGIMEVIGNLFKKIFLPLFIISTAVQVIMGIIDGFKEEGIIGGIKGGLVALFDALIGWPLNLLKDGVAWILSKLGFEKAAAALDSFDFTTMFSDFVDWVSSLLGVAFTWVKEKFSAIIAWFSSFVDNTVNTVKEWFSNLLSWATDSGVPWLSNFVDGVVQKVKDWFGNLLSWARESEEGNWILDKINALVEKVKDFFTQIFDFLPNIDEVIAKFKDLLPDFMKSDETVDPETEKYKNMTVTADTSDDELIAMAAAQDTMFTSEEGLFRRLKQEREAARMNGTTDPTTPARVTPSTAPDSGVLAASSNVANVRAAAGVGNYSSSPTVIPISAGGGGQGGNTNNNVQTSTYNISQGMTADDMIRGDWVMPIAP